MAKKKIISIAVDTPLNQEGIHPLYILGAEAFPDGPKVIDISYRRDAGMDICIKHDAAYVVKFEGNAIEHAVAAKFVINVATFDEGKAAQLAAEEADKGIPGGHDA